MNFGSELLFFFICNFKRFYYLRTSCIQQMKLIETKERNKMSYNLAYNTHVISLCVSSAMEYHQDMFIHVVLWKTVPTNRKYWCNLSG